MSYRYVRSLSNALWAVGIRGRLARRITTEIADHLSEDPEADLGSPETLAAEFADELGTARARTAAAEVFAALTLVGGLLLGAFLASRAAGVRWPAVQPRYSFLALAGGGAFVIGAQVAFVAGVLAAIRALRLRRERVIPRAEARVIVRRAAVALAGGLAATAGVALIGFDLQAGVPGWVTTVVVAAADGSDRGLLRRLRRCSPRPACSRWPPAGAATCSTTSVRSSPAPTAGASVDARDRRRRGRRAGGRGGGRGPVGSVRRDRARTRGRARGLAGFAVLGGFLGLRA